VEVPAECFADQLGGGGALGSGALEQLALELWVESYRFDTSWGGPECWSAALAAACDEGVGVVSGLGFGGELLDLSAAFQREVVIKNETLTPIGSFTGRGTWLLAQELDPARTWVCSTAGNFGQGLAYAARACGATVEAFVSADVPAAKIASMRGLGAHVLTTEQPDSVAREHAAATEDRLLVVDGLHPEMAEGAGTIGVELQASGPIDVAVVQIGDGALISGIARWLKARQPRTRIVGVCASGAPAMARSFAAGRVVATPGTNTIATALARHSTRLLPGRIAVLLTGAGHDLSATF
jgi:threonine dehydratase